MIETIKDNCAYRIMADLDNKVWHKISMWKLAKDIEFTNGSNAQTNLGSITGITDSLTSTSSTTCASSNAIKLLNDKLTELQNS